MTSSWLPKDWTKTIVAIGQKIKEEKDGKIEEKFDLQATGFLVSKGIWSILVTTKHVVIDKKTSKIRKGLFVACNSHSEEISKLSIDTIHDDLNTNWVFHENKEIDIAAIPFPINFEKQNLKMLNNTMYCAFNDATEGSDLFYLGFPMKITPDNRIMPVVRPGSIALKYSDKLFLFDGLVYPGNSGGPIFLKPTFVNFDTMEIGKLQGPKLLGIVSSYIPYEDYAISPQTGRTRIVFEENSGLATAFSSDYILEIIKSKQMDDEIEKMKTEFDKNKGEIKGSTS